MDQGEIRMSATRNENQVVTPTEPISTPPYTGHHDHSFTLQTIMELQKSMGELTASVNNMSTILSSTKSKVDDLVAWKNKILGGAIVLGAVTSVLGFIIAKLI